jgi:hypothetical protein
VCRSRYRQDRDDDPAALVTAPPALRQRGLLVVTTPADRGLWSGHGLGLDQRRRDAARELRRAGERVALGVAAQR